MSTVEAIQVYLQNLGWILFPWDESSPPGFITDEQIRDLGELRIFENRNDRGPSHFYKRDVYRYQWEFDHTEAGV